MNQRLLGRGVFVANPDAVTVYGAEPPPLQAVVGVPDFPMRGVATVDGAAACFICTAANQLVAIEVGSVVP